MSPVDVQQLYTLTWYILELHLFTLFDVGVIASTKMKLMNHPLPYACMVCVTLLHYYYSKYTEASSLRLGCEYGRVLVQPIE